MTVTPSSANTQVRLYRELARKLIAELSSGKYAVGDRLPAERELSAEHDVSRPTVREAIIALEVQGLVEVRVGSGAYVRRLPGKGDIPGFNITAFELTEARLLFEGEAAALAAMQISPEELAILEQQVRDIDAENLSDSGTELADREFHLTIARATRNTAILNALRDHNPADARAAMRTHLSAVLDSLLFATEEKAIEAARSAAAAKRARYSSI